MINKKLYNPCYWGSFFVKGNTLGLNQILMFFIFCILGLVSCQEKKKVSDMGNANILFVKTTQLLIEKTSEIEQLSDSMALIGLEEEINKALTTINFSVPPQTDFLLSEQENDSIIKLMENFKESLQERYKALSATIYLTDSI